MGEIWAILGVGWGFWRGFEGDREVGLGLLVAGGYLRVGGVGF